MAAWIIIGVVVLLVLAAPALAALMLSSIISREDER
jgi:hypothetical protein